MNQCLYITINPVHALFIFPQFSLHVVFCPRTPHDLVGKSPWTLGCDGFSAFPWFLWSWQFLGGLARYFVECLSFVWCSDWGDVLGRKPTDQGDIISVTYHVDVNLDHMAWGSVCQLFPLYRYLCPLSFHTVLFGRKAAHAWVTWGVTLHILRGGVSM